MEMWREVHCSSSRLDELFDFCHNNFVRVVDLVRQQLGNDLQLSVQSARILRKEILQNEIFRKEITF